MLAKFLTNSTLTWWQNTQIEFLFVEREMNTPVEKHFGVTHRKCITFAMTSGSGSSMGSAHSTVTTFPHTFTLPLISRRRAWAAVLWSSYSKKQKPRFFFLSSGWWYNMTSFRPSVMAAKGEKTQGSRWTWCIDRKSVTGITLKFKKLRGFFFLSYKSEYCVKCPVRS